VTRARVHEHVEGCLSASARRCECVHATLHAYGMYVTYTCASTSTLLMKEERVVVVGGID